jgi:import inner membrane translocase subunit TIM21
VHSQIAVDSTGREHLFLHFYVSGRAPGSVKSDPSVSYADAALDWIEEGAQAIGKTVRDGAVLQWARETADAAATSARDTFRYVTGQPIHPSPRKPPDALHNQEEEAAENNAATGWGLAGLFQGLRGALRTQSVDTDSRHDRRTFTDGEVHADFVRVCCASSAIHNGS